MSDLDGSYGGFQPKPAVEVIIVAMKPLSEKTFVDQALANGKGVTWLDDCRVPTSENNGRPQGSMPQPMDWGKSTGLVTEGDARGRFPANLLVSDDVLNDGRKHVGTHSQKPTDGVSGFGHRTNSGNFDGGSGSYSRYFSLDAWAEKLPERVQKVMPFILCPKASKREKNPNDVKNAHPTVKPLQLMSYLVTLGSRPDDVVLDPFLGSGSTAIAAKLLGRRYIGIERESEYVEIALARLETVRDMTKPLPLAS